MNVRLLFRVLALLFCESPDTKCYRRTARNLLTEYELMKRTAKGRAQLRLLQDGRSFKLNLGCGPNIKEKWINIDMQEGPSVYELDLRKSLPLPDGSCSIIYSEHFFEHIEYPRPAEDLLRDYARLLQPGGMLSIGVPDGEIALRAYAGDDNQDFFNVSKERWHPSWANTRMEQINYMFRQDGEHRFIYDEETLLGSIRRAGFVEARRRAFDPQLDTVSRAWGTLYVEARRPEKV